MEKQDHQQTRKAFNRQPVQYLLIDLTCLAENQHISSLCKALDFLFTTISVMKGSVRVPGLGIGVINSNYVSVLPIETTKGSYLRLKVILEELRSLMEKQIQGEDCRKKATYETSIVIALHEATTQFQKYSEKYASTLNNSESLQLQITILSYENGEKCAKCVENSLADLGAGQVKKVQVVKIGSKVPVPVASGQSNDSATGVSIDALIDVTSIAGDKYSVDSFFRTWLKDCSTEVEHLHLALPDGNAIKCDVNERILELGCFPFSQFVRLKTDPGCTQTIIPNRNKTNATQLPIYKLKIISLVQASGICESLMFGNPVIVTPTLCWKMDYDELDKNQQYFRHLNVYLKEKNLAAILKRWNIEGRKPANNLTDHYVMLPGSSNRMVVRHVATYEQSLPNASTYSEKVLTKGDVTSEITTAMRKLTVETFYDPLKYSSGLFGCISESFGKNARNSGQGKPSANWAHIRPKDVDGESCRNSSTFRRTFPREL